MTTSECIKFFRQKNGLTQKQLAEKTGLSIASIQGYEQNKFKPKLEQLRRIAAALNISIGDLKPDWSNFSVEEISSDITYVLPLDELGLLQNYRLLNVLGQNEAVKRISELTEIKKYTEKESE